MPTLKKIFLIDDDRDFARSFCQALIKEGYNVTANSSAEMAKTWATSKDLGFDMIIADQRMPGEVGSSFLAFLAELERTEPERLDKNSKIYQEVRRRFSSLNDFEFQSFLKRIKVHPHKRVILSGYAEDDGIRNALEQGQIHKYISKKRPIPEVLAAIRSLLEQP